MDAHDTGLALFGIIYFTIAMLTSKGLHAYKLWDNKRQGYYNWHDVDPTKFILIGLIWPFTIPAIAAFYICAFVICGIRFIFFRE